MITLSQNHYNLIKIHLYCLVFLLTFTQEALQNYGLQIEFMTKTVCLDKKFTQALNI